jgi:hypothetical protein
MLKSTTWSVKCRRPRLRTVKTSMQIEVHSYKRCLFQLYGLLINRYFVCVARDIYDKMKADLRLMKEEMQRIETSRTPKV